MKINKIKKICENNAINYDSFNLKGSDYDLSNKHNCNNLFIAIKQIVKLACKEQKIKCRKYFESQNLEDGFKEDEIFSEYITDCPIIDFE